MSKYPLSNFAWWKFANSPTGRSYLEAEIYPQSAGTKPIRVATTQLEFATLPSPMWCLERYTQAEHAVTALRSAENVVFGGDMCWSDDTDRPFPLLAGWIDAWLRRSPSDSSWTYDGLWNEDLVSCNGFSRMLLSLKNRSDRFVCKLKDYRVDSMELIGDQSVGFKYRKPKVFESIYLPPSCHRGLILTIVPIE